MTAAISTEALTKRYGPRTGIEDLTLSVEAGVVFGYLGPNGAGKTTTIRTLLDYIRPTSGRALVLGMDSHRSTLEIRRRTGYLPGDLALYERMTGAQLLRFAARMRDGAGGDKIDELAERLTLDLSIPTGTLSHGNKRKIGLIQAFMHAPDLLLLDEPTLGLDPIVQHEFHRMVREAAGRGATVFLSSHVLSEVEQMCDEVGIVREGRLVTVDDIGKLKMRARRRVEIHFERPVPTTAFTGLANVEEVEALGDTIRCVVTGPVDPVVKAASRFTVLGFTTHEPSLEDAFMSYYEGRGRARDAVPEDAA